MSNEEIEVKPLKSISIELNQMKIFYEDLVKLNDLTDDEYLMDFRDLRDDTDYVRSKFAGLYAKILNEHPELEKNIE